MNGEYVEHWIDGSSPVSLQRCVTCGALLVYSDIPAHTQWHEIIQDVITYPPTVLVTSLDDVEPEDTARDNVPCRGCGHIFLVHEDEGGCSQPGCDCEAKA